MKNILKKDQSYSNLKIIAKLSSIIAFIFITLSLIIIKITPASSGYELSIYSAYPWFLWVFLIGAIIIGILIIFKEILSETKSNIWIVGLFSILLSNLIILLLPYFRGYAISGGASADIFTHYGWISEIANTGQIFENNFYPIIHTFTVLLSESIGLDINQILWFIPPLFSVLYVLFIYLFSKVISKNHEQSLLITLISTPLIFAGFHISIAPSFFSFMSLPLLLYLYHKRSLITKKLEITLLILIICFLIVFFHPMTTLFTILIFITFIVSESLLNKIKDFKEKTRMTINPYKPINIILILIVAFFAWYTSHGEGLEAIKTILLELSQSTQQTIAAEYSNLLTEANLSIFQFLQLLFIRYGTILLFVLAALISVLIVLKNTFRNENSDKIQFTYSLQWLVALFVAFSMIFSYLIVTSPIRSSRYMILMSTIIIGLVGYSLISKNKKKKKLKSYIYPFLIIFLLIVSCTLCTFNMHDSPNIWQPNKQFTKMNYDGSTWFSSNRDIDVDISHDIGFNLLRTEHFIYGVSEGDNRSYTKTNETPSHFGYDEYKSILDTFDNRILYLITTKNGIDSSKAFPEKIQEKVRQYTKEDIKKLEADENANKIFDNGEMKCWLIK
jgi:hypothetical protein